MKENKRFLITIIKKHITDYSETDLIIAKDIYRTGKSKKQVESRLRHQFNLFNYDEDYSGAEIQYLFLIEELDWKQKQKDINQTSKNKISIFDDLDD